MHIPQLQKNLSICAGSQFAHQDETQWRYHTRKGDLCGKNLLKIEINFGMLKRK
jgi:hypothetical protein